MIPEDNVLKIPIDPETGKPEVDDLPDRPLALHIGSNAGEVVIEFSRETKAVNLTPGEALNIANRLRMQAEGLLHR
jgi:class 3 adenylate cyclase